MSFFDDYEISEELGRGGYGVVYAAESRDRKDKRAYVAKFLRVEKILERRLASVDKSLKSGRVTDLKAEEMRRKVYSTLYIEIENEFKMLKLAYAKGARNIVRYVNYYKSVEYNDEDNAVIVMLRVPGFTLSKMWKCFASAKEHIPKMLLRKIAFDTLSTLAKLHSLNIVHRDIKNANMIYDTDSKSVKYIDFGFSCVTDLKSALNEDGQIDPSLLCGKRSIGSAGSYAPEMIDNRYKAESLEVLKKIDVWELGVALYQLENLRRPFKNEKATLDNDREPSDGPDRLLNKFIERMLTHDFHKRLSAQALFDTFSIILSLSSELRE